MHGLFSPDLCRRLRGNVPPEPPQAVTNNPKTKSLNTDTSRTQELLQKDLHTELVELVTGKLHEHVAGAAGLTKVMPKILRSKRSRTEQHLHSDYLQDELDTHTSAWGKPPGTLLASLEPGGQIWILAPDGFTVVRLPLMLGDAVWFDGTVLHAGSSYENPHVRIHMYVMHPEFARQAAQPGQHEELNPGTAVTFPRQVLNTCLYIRPS